MNGKFPIGFWNYVNINNQTADDVKDWYDLGMTMACSPEFGKNDDPEKMISILDACESSGIDVIICDARTRWSGASVTPAEYEERFLKAYNDFGRHPAVRGFHIGDEPTNKTAFDDCVAAYGIQKKLAPQLTPFLNLLPYWHGIEDSILHCDDFTAWLEDFIEKGKMDSICYDCYWQMNPEESGVQSYFENLRHYVDAAEARGADPWTTLLSVGHFRYRCPNEDDLRWQLNTAVASGMKGILWFFVYERAPQCNYRVPPIDEFGERTETYEHLSRVNRHFLHKFGDFFLTAKHLSTYHIKKSFGGYPLFENGKTDKQLSCIETKFADVNGIVSFFEKDSVKCAAVVNNDVKESAMFSIRFSKDAGVRQICRLNWDAKFYEFRQFCGDASYEENDSEIIIGDWLAPGQMNVYRIDC